MHYYVPHLEKCNTTGKDLPKLKTNQYLSKITKNCNGTLNKTMRALNWIFSLINVKNLLFFGIHLLKSQFIYQNLVNIHFLFTKLF